MDPVPFMKSRDGLTNYLSDANFLYAERNGKMHRLDLFDKHYYKLRLYNGVPILEIDGLRMQLVKDFDTPLDYAKEVVKGLVVGSKKSAQVLDTCMGLGYTAIEASKHENVASVITCEYAEPVITLAKWNPLSESLFEKDGKITVIQGSIAERIRKMPSSSFDFIIHDPPRFSHAPDLYSLEFYKELFRVSKKGARIFHYVGTLGAKKGKHIEAGASQRFSEAGFCRIRYVRRLQGIFASK
jgi:predicted methyltransferase